MVSENVLATFLLSCVHEFSSVFPTGALKGIFLCNQYIILVYFFYRFLEHRQSKYPDHGIYPCWCCERRLHMFCRSGSLLQVLMRCRSQRKRGCLFYAMYISFPRFLDVVLYTYKKYYALILYTYISLMRAFVLSLRLYVDAWCRRPASPLSYTLRWICRGLSRIQHDFSCGRSLVGGRGCFPCVYVCSSMLQVSRSTQKLLVLPQVSAQTDQVVPHNSASA